MNEETKEAKHIVIKIKTTGLENTPAIEEYVRRKIDLLGKFLAFYAKESGELVFEIEIGKTTGHHRKGDVFRAEFNFNGGGVRLRTEAERDDLYAAIDEAKDEMAGEFVREKNKVLHMMKRGGAAIKNILRGGVFGKFKEF